MSLCLLLEIGDIYFHARGVQFKEHHFVSFSKTRNSSGMKLSMGAS